MSILGMILSAIGVAAVIGITLVVITEKIRSK